MEDEFQTIREVLHRVSLCRRPKSSTADRRQGDVVPSGQGKMTRVGSTADARGVKAICLKGFVDARSRARGQVACAQSRRMCVTGNDAR